MKKVVIIVVNEQEYLPEVQQIVRNDIHFSPENDGRDCTIDVSQPITRELRPLNKDDLIFHLVSTYFSVLVAAQTHKEPRSDYLWEPQTHSEWRAAKKSDLLWFTEEVRTAGCRYEQLKSQTDLALL